MIFYLRQIQEKCREQWRSLWLWLPISLPIKVGVKPGDKFSPILLVLYMAALGRTLPTPSSGISLRTLSNKGLFNLCRLKAKGKTTPCCILEHSYKHLQTTSDTYVEAYDRCGLDVSIKKTMLLAQLIPGEDVPSYTVCVHGEEVKQV